MALLFALLVTMASLLVLSILFVLIGQSVHKGMTVDDSNEWDYGTFASFLAEVQKRKWEDHGWPCSLFNDPDQSKLHADIVKFSGKGMVLRWHNYIQYKYWMHKIRRNTDKRKKGLWS